MKRSFLVLTVAALVSTAAAGEWSDNFDSYSTGENLQGVGGWKGWDNSGGAAAKTSDKQALSSPNSVDILRAADLVHEYEDITEGQWVYTAWQFIPSGFSGTTYFILLNTYNDGGPYSWSVQLPFNSSTKKVTDDFDPEASLDLVLDKWVELRVEIDLDADSRSVYYDGNLLSTVPWTSQGGDAVTSLAAVDLYANNSNSVYYDDMSLVPEPTAGLLIVLAAAAALRRR